MPSKALKGHNFCLSGSRTPGRRFHWCQHQVHHTQATDFGAGHGKLMQNEGIRQQNHDHKTTDCRNCKRGG